MNKNDIAEELDRLRVKIMNDERITGENIVNISVSEGVVYGFADNGKVYVYLKETKEWKLFE